MVQQGHTGNQGRIRLIIQQRSLAKYRLPVYQHLARRPGIDLTLVYARNPGVPNVAADGFSARCEPMWHVPMPGRRVFWHSAQWRCATAQACDVLMLDGSLQHAALVPALLRARRHGVPTILWTHGYSKNDARWRRRMRLAVSRLAAAMLLYNDQTARQYLQMGFAADRVFVALNSLDQAPIRAAAASWRERSVELAQFAERHDLTGKSVILFVSRLERANGVDLLLKAVSLLRRDFANLKLVIIGTGPDEDRLRAMTASLGLERQVLMPGPIYEEMELAPWFLNADVFCYPQNIGLSLLHAFGYGLPVVTCDRVEAQNPEIAALHHGENGLQYAHGDAPALAAALRQLLEQAPLRQKMSRGAEATVRERFTVERMVDGMEAAVRYCHGLRGAR